MNVEAINAAIAELPEAERHSLAARLNELEYDDRDRQMAKDFSPGGRGHHLVEQVKRDIAAGKAHPIEEGFADRPKSRA
jgi:hypothetical protein